VSAKGDPGISTDRVREIAWEASDGGRHMYTCHLEFLENYARLVAKDVQQTMDEKHARFTGNVIIAEISLFLLGMFIGALFMKSYGWRPLW